MNFQIQNNLYIFEVETLELLQKVMTGTKIKHINVNLMDPSLTSLGNYEKIMKNIFILNSNYTFI